MASRFSLMQQIAELDRQLSKRGAHPSLREQSKAMKRFAEILDSAEDADEFTICQAIHFLMRKHDLQPTTDWPVRHPLSTPAALAQQGRPLASAPRFQLKGSTV